MTDRRLNVQSLVRVTHKERVLETLRTHGALDRAGLERITRISRTTLSAIVRDLIAAGLVVEIAGPASARRDPGRPAALLTLNPSGGLALGIELSHRSVHIAIANVAHEAIAVDQRPIAAEMPWASRVKTALEVVNELAEASNISMDALGGVGVGVVGPIVEAAGVPREGLAGRAQLVRRVVEEHLEVPVYLDNNARLAGLAEAIWGSGRGYQHVTYVRLSEGVGGAVVINGRLFLGHNGAAGQFGHVCVDPQGPQCQCGGRGCLESYASLGAVLERCQTDRLEDVLERLRDGDPQVRQIIADVGRRLGQVLAASCNVVDPEVVIVGGELAAAGEELLKPTVDQIRAHTHRWIRDSRHVRAGELDASAAARGAIALVLHESALLAGYPSTADMPRTAIKPLREPPSMPPARQETARYVMTGASRAETTGEHDHAIHG